MQRSCFQYSSNLYIFWQVANSGNISITVVQQQYLLFSTLIQASLHMVTGGSGRQDKFFHLTSVLQFNAFWVPTIVVNLTKISEFSVVRYLKFSWSNFTNFPHNAGRLEKHFLTVTSTCLHSLLKRLEDLYSLNQLMQFILVLLWKIVFMLFKQVRSCSHLTQTLPLCIFTIIFSNGAAYILM